MSQSNLSLRIYGGALSSGLDRQPLVSVGNAPEGFIPMPPTLVDEQQSWLITHAQNYTAYMSYSKRCQTQDDQPGQLLICLFFNPQQRLADGNSPLGLLDSLNDCFAVQAMQGGKLPTSPVDNSPFKMLLDRYRLEQRPMLLPVMSGHEPASFCAENRAQLDAFMRHSRYPVLMGVGRLELGLHCKSTIALASTGKPQKKEPEQQPIPVTPIEPEREQEQETELEPEPFQYDNYSSGGLDLDDTPYIPESTPWYKKPLPIVLACIGTLVGLFLILTIFFMITGKTDRPYAEEEEEEVYVDSADSVEVISSQQEYEPADDVVADPVIANDENDMAEEAALKAKEAEEARRKAEEAARQEAAEEEARLKKAEETRWMDNIRSRAQSCPIQLRVGVKISSITCTSNAVTITINYDELSKYDLDESDRNRIASDRSDVIRRYGSDIPSGTRINVVQKDRAGREL